MTKPRYRGGSASLYTPAMADTILSRMSTGETLLAICADEGMPSRGTILRWRESLPEFDAAYQRAREAQAHAIAEKGLAEALRAGEKDDGLDPQSARVRFDAARWFAGRMAPRVYGDKLDLSHSGEVTVRLDPEKRRARIAELQARLAGAPAEGADGEEPA